MTARRAARLGPAPVPLADWEARAIGFLIDLVPLVVLAVIVRSYVVLVVSILYMVLLGKLDGVTGQTPGKAMMGIRLVDGEGRSVGSGAGVGRKFLRCLDMIPAGLGNLLPLIDVRRQTLADKLIGSYVVAGAEKKPLSLDLWVPPKS